MHIEVFENHDDMQEAIARNAEAAKRGLHAAQANITYGDHWVQFADGMVIFGRVHTLDEIRESEGEYADEVIATTESMMEDGLMFGEAYSAPFPEVELGYTHKVSVWPIEKELFDAAREVDWRTGDLPEWAMVQAKIAAAEWVMHERSKR